MHTCECNDNLKPSDRTHVFVDLNGFPYLLAEYINRNKLQHVDRSCISSGITVDTSDAMRAIIDIKINDIGERSDCTPNIIGNNTKQKRLLNIISNHSNRLDGKLPVLKSGIIIRVNYQLENQRTRQVLRSMVEDLRIFERNYFIDINRLNFNDNAIVVNFASSIVSSINEFTHGRDRMIIRITNVQMFYESVNSGQSLPRIKQSLTPHQNDFYTESVIPGTNEEYFYHQELQHRHYIGDPPMYIGYDEGSKLYPPSWAMFNEYYHFDQDGRRIIFHFNEIYDPLRKVNMIPCGTVAVNRTFIINPGHRLIFKFSIWKNDVTAIFDTLNVAKALKAKFYNCCNDHHHDNYHDDRDHSHKCDCNHYGKPPINEPPHHDHHRPDEYNQLINMLYDERKQNETNGKLISELLDKIKILEDKLNNSETNPGEPPLIPDDPTEDCECGCDHTEINDKIDGINQRLDDEDIDPMPEEVIEEIFNNVINNKEGEI